MEKRKGMERADNVGDTAGRRSKRKAAGSMEKTPTKKKPHTVTSRKEVSKKFWKFIIPEKSWFPGKITTSVSKGVLSTIQTNLSQRQKRIVMGTCFAHFMECQEIMIQPQLIHYFLLRQVYQPNAEEMWFYVAGRYVRFSISEFCLVTGLRCSGDSDTQAFDARPSQMKTKYFAQVDSISHEDVKSTFLSACQMPDLDLVEALPDEDIAMMGILYFITAYLFPRDYKKVVDHYLFVLVEDFSAMNEFPWGKLLFDITLSSLRDGLSRRSSHYRLRGMLVAFQVWIYETFPSLDGIVVTRISRMHPRIKNWSTQEQPSGSKLEGTDCFANPNIKICDLEPSEIESTLLYMDGVHYNKPKQPGVSRGSSSMKTKREKSADRAGTSGKSVILLTPSSEKRETEKSADIAVASGKSLIMLTDSSVGRDGVTDDDDDFVDPPPRCPQSSPYEQPHLDECTSDAPPTPNEPQSERVQRDDASQGIEELIQQISELKSSNTVLALEIDAIKSQMSDINAEHSKKLDDVLLVQGQIRSDLMEIRTNMQFLSESVTAMISSSMDEVIRRFNEKTCHRDDGAQDKGTEAAGDSDKTQEAQAVEPTVDRKGKRKMCPSDALPYSLEPPSFDLGFGDSQPDELHSEDILKQVDAVVSDVVKTATMDVTEVSPTSEPPSSLPVKRVSRPARILRSPFIVGERNLSKHDDNVVVFETYKDNVEEGDRSAFLGWFQRGYKPKNRKKFNEQDDLIKPPFVIGSFTVGHKTWFHELINDETSLSSAHMDVCFYYIRQLAKFGKKLELKATTTNTWFQNKMKDLYPAFVKDPNAILSDSSLIDAVTGHSIPLSTPWADVDYAFIPILPTNKAHWMLGLLIFRTHTLMVFNSAGKTYHEWKVLQGIEPYVKILPRLMDATGISKKNPDYNESERMELKVIVDSTLPQQTNGHDCGIFVILYALYILRDGRSSIPYKFDASKRRLDIASLLYKHRESYVKKAKQATKEGGTVLD